MNEKPFALTVLTSEDRAELIARAQYRIVYVGPGISPRELAALISAQTKLPPQAIQVVVDLSPAAFKAGYWENQSPHELTELLKLSSMAQIGKGLRLGLIVVDEESYLYTPTAQSIEPERHDAEEANAVRLSPEETERLIASILQPRQTNQRQRPPISETAVEHVQEQLQRQEYVPPINVRLLDFLRKVISIVQFEVTGYQLTRKTLRLPQEIIDLLGAQDSEIAERLSASWRVFGSDKDADQEIAQQQQAIQREIENLKSEYLRPLSHYGFGLVDSQREQFEQRWQKFQTEIVKTYQALLESKVEGMVARSKESLRKLINDRIVSGQLKVTKTPSLLPRSDEEEQKYYVEKLINSVRWPKAKELSGHVVIKVRHYAVTDELLRDEEFTKALEKEFDIKLADIQKQVEVERRPTKPVTPLPFSLN